MGCLTGTVRFLLKLFNYLLLLSGLTLLCYAIVLLTSSTQPVVITLAVFSAVFVFTGLLGALSVVNGKYKVLLWLHDALLVSITLFQLFLVIGFFAVGEKTVRLFLSDASDNDPARITQLRDAVNNNPIAWKMAMLIILGFELAFVILQFCFHNRILRTLDDEEDDKLDVALLPSQLPKEEGVSKTPKTDEARTKMIEKYGDRFRKGPAKSIEIS